MNLSRFFHTSYRRPLRLLLPLLLCSSVASAQLFRETVDAATFELQGPVRKVERTVTLFEGDVSTPLPHLDTMTFNKKGFLKEALSRDTESDRVTEHIVYDHNGSGKLRTVETYQQEQLLRRDESRYRGRNWRATFYYDAEEQLEAVATVRGYRKEVPGGVPHRTYTFDEAMRPLVERTYFPDEDEPVRTVRYTYEDGRLTKAVERGPEGELLSREVYIYDESGRVEVKRFYDATDSERTRTRYRYDEHGNVVNERTVDGEDTLVALLRYRYTYDEQGNWLTKTTLFRDSEEAEFEQQSLETRTIKYHREG